MILILFGLKVEHASGVLKLCKNGGIIPKSSTRSDEQEHGIIVDAEDKRLCQLNISLIC